jgi:hypothetical protein
MKTYQFEFENINTNERKVVTLKCNDPVNIIRSLGHAGWLVQTYIALEEGIQKVEIG